MRTPQSIMSWIGLVVGTLVVARQAVQWRFLIEQPLGNVAVPETLAPLVGVGLLLLLAVALVLSWRWPLVGAVGFLGYFVLRSVAGVIVAFPSGLFVFEMLLAAGHGLAGALLLGGWLSERRREVTAQAS